MRILHISSARTWRGGEQQLLYLVKGLDKLGESNFICAPIGATIINKLAIPDKCVLRYKKNLWSNVLLPFKISNFIEKWNIDIIHVHDSHGHNYVWMGMMFKKISVPVIVHRRVDFKPGFLSFMKYNHQGISKYICVSKAICNILGKVVIKKERLTVVYSGIELAPADFSRKTFLRKTFSIPAKNVVVANIAALAPHKDCFTFIDVAIELKRRGMNNISFLLIGADAGEEKKIQAYITRHNMDPYITLTGFIENIGQQMHEIDILLVTSQEEGLNTTVLNAFNQKVPVVSTNAGGLKELVIHGNTGLLAQIKDKIALANYVQRLLYEDDLRNLIVKNAYHSIQYFDYNQMTLQIKNIYKQSLETNEQLKMSESGRIG